MGRECSPVLSVVDVRGPTTINAEAAEHAELFDTLGTRRHLILAKFTSSARRSPERLALHAQMICFP